MLPKINRLKLDGDFQKVFRSGKTSENSFLKIKFYHNDKQYSRLGFVVGGKFSKQAVARNLIKRRLRAAGSSLLKNIKVGVDIVVWPKIICIKADYSSVLKAFREILTKNDFLLV